MGSPEGPAALEEVPATELLASEPSCKAPRTPTAAGPSRGDRIMSSDRSTRSCTYGTLRIGHFTREEGNLTFLDKQ